MENVRINAKLLLHVTLLDKENVKLKTVLRNLVMIPLLTLALLVQQQIMQGASNAQLLMELLLALNVMLVINCKIQIVNVFHAFQVTKLVMTLMQKLVQLLMKLMLK